MFETVRRQLIVSYFIVLSIILSTFAVSVRIVFARSLDRQQLMRLETLARAAALELEIEDEGEVEVDDELIIGSEQGVQWFDLEGNLLDEQGEHILQLPFQPQRIVQQQQTPYSIKSLTIPVNDYDTGVFIGYTRVSESRAEIELLLQRLDWGLLGSIILALILSASGGAWLLRQAMEPIEQSFRKLQQFTSDAAHELRSPLMAISANAEVALKYDRGIRVLDAEKFQAIKSASRQLTNLTEELLFLARNDREVIRQHEPLNLTSILQELVELYQPQAKTQNLQLAGQLESSLWVSGDRLQLTRLFVSLLDNALRYTPSGGQVEMNACLNKKNEVQISVRDTGIGISPEHLQKVFDRFWQANRARSYQAQGFGLGLSIASTIARNHRGSIAVSSELGLGSCFTVSLPYLDTSQDVRAEN